jgi:hypothetical protein
MPDDKKIFALDLTKRPPRSPHLRLGGYALLPGMLDKDLSKVWEALSRGCRNEALTWSIRASMSRQLFPT